MPPIAKSTFLQFQVCPKDTWLRLHRPELTEEFAPSEFDKQLMEQGNEVESHARKLFPDAVLISATRDDAVAETRRLMVGATDTILQATFLAGGFYAKCDVLKRGAEAESWDLYEIKGTNSRKEGNEDRNHISDLAFQTITLALAGVKLGRAFIVHLNKDYVRDGNLDIPALFVVADSTELVENVAADIRREMKAAREYLNQQSEPSIGCDCHLKGRSRQCRTFAYSHPEIPEYSVHDIAGIGRSKKKLEELMSNRIFKIDDVPNDYELGAAQRLQVRAHKTQKPIIDYAAIEQVLSAYMFPLYFLDYETYAPAIPAFDRYRPYRRIPFQFSLHILQDETREPEHVEFLQIDRLDPTLSVAELLDRHIGSEGTVIAWYASFERGVNKEVGERLGGAHAIRMERISRQMHDLRDIFSKLYYVHPGFRGSTSIKDVMPVLVPELSYDGLAIRDGTTASEQWWTMTAAETTESERAAIAAALKAYCGQDSLAMYSIWRKLSELGN